MADTDIPQGPIDDSDWKDANWTPPKREYPKKKKFTIPADRSMVPAIDPRALEELAKAYIAGKDLTTVIPNTGLSAVMSLNQDLREASTSLTFPEIRLIVNMYYMIQRDRIRAENQIRALSDPDKPRPSKTVLWFYYNAKFIETNLFTMLQIVTSQHEISRWARTIFGIGPVISAGLLAHIDIERAPTVGHIWSFGGVVGPSQVWKPGEKRPWCADFKVLIRKIGASFAKTYNRPKDVYGKVYIGRKYLEQERNTNRLFQDQAKDALTKKNYSQDTIAYQYYRRGLLPPAHIDARAMRYAAKIFLSHYHWVLHEIRYNKLPPKPFILNRDQSAAHIHLLCPPNWPMEDNYEDRMDTSEIFRTHVDNVYGTEDAPATVPYKDMNIDPSLAEPLGEQLYREDDPALDEDPPEEPKPRRRRRPSGPSDSPSSK